MNINIHNLEKVIKEQNKQIDSLKKAISILNNKLYLVDKKAKTTGVLARKNSKDINSLKQQLTK